MIKKLLARYNELIESGAGGNFDVTVEIAADWRKLRKEFVLQHGADLYVAEMANDEAEVNDANDEGALDGGCDFTLIDAVTVGDVKTNAAVTDDTEVHEVVTNDVEVVNDDVANIAVADDIKVDATMQDDVDTTHDDVDCTHGNVDCAYIDVNCMHNDVDCAHDDEDCDVIFDNGEAGATRNEVADGDGCALDAGMVDRAESLVLE